MMMKINGRQTSVAFMLVLFLLLLAFSHTHVSAQEERGGTPQGEVRPPSADGDLVRQLNLTRDQIEKIRAIREQNREARLLIGQRVRAARMSLDRAIYVDNADESVVQERARELAEAQAANIRLQAMTELGIRRILTPEQLQTFRALRLRAEMDRRNRRRRENANRPSQTDEGGPPLRGRLRRGRNAPGQTDGNTGQGLSPGRRRGRP